MKIGVFCSANINIDQSYINASRDFGAWLGASGHTLVWGGCSLGLMGVVGLGFIEGRASAAAKGSIVGVVPDIIEEKGKNFSPMDETVSCRNLSERKDIIVENSDILVALPGGIGTLDEIFTVASSSSIGYHSKKTILYNVDGFWQPLAELLEHLQAKGMIRGCFRDKIDMASSLEELTVKLK